MEIEYILNVCRKKYKISNNIYLEIREEAKKLDLFAISYSFRYTYVKESHEMGCLLQILLKLWVTLTKCIGIDKVII